MNLDVIDVKGATVNTINEIERTDKKEEIKKAQEKNSRAITINIVSKSNFQDNHLVEEQIRRLDLHI